MTYPVIDKRSWDRVPSSVQNQHKFLAVHYLGIDAGQNYNLYGGGYGGHACVYLDGTIYLRCYDAATIWAVGVSNGFKRVHPTANNGNTWSIEMCCYNTNHSSSGSDKTWYFTQATQEACVQLVRQKFQEWGWPLTKESIDEHLLRHGDITTKICPAPYCTCEGYKGEKGQNWYWSEFKEAVRTGKCPNPAATPTPSQSEAAKTEQWWRVRKVKDDRTTQLGAYEKPENAIAHCPEGYYVFDPDWNIIYPPQGLQAKDLKDLSEAEVVAKMGSYFTADERKSGILACVSMAQFILESGYGHTELAQNANNCFGMKKSLSGNTWEGTTWDGKSIYTKQTKEQNPDGTVITITADFRKYPRVEDSIADHSAYLLGAKKGDALRYDGLKGCQDYKKAVQIIKDGGYATSLTYVEKLCDIIERWNLTKYNVKQEVSNSTPTSQASNSQASETSFKEYQVKVVVTNLNIRKGPGTNYSKTGKVTGKGVFTIVAEADGAGAPKWGKLKSGAGWIALNPDWVKKV